MAYVKKKKGRFHHYKTAAMIGFFILGSIGIAFTALTIGGASPAVWLTGAEKVLSSNPDFRLSAASTDGLIGYWRFDGNGNNEVAGKPTATTTGSGAVFKTEGGKNSGYAYVATQSDLVKIPYNSAYDLPDSFTIEFWFRQRSNQSFNQNLIYKGTPTNNYNFNISRWLWNEYNYGPVIAGHTAANSGYWTQPSNPNQLAHNEWHHVVFTKSPTYHAYYLDGILIGSKDVSTGMNASDYGGPAKTPPSDIIVGDTAVDTDFDDLRIYNRALSLDEVLANGGFPARVRICEQGGKRCNDNLLENCSADGYSWNYGQYCSYGCNASTFVCNDPPPVTSSTTTTTITTTTTAASSTATTTAQTSQTSGSYAATAPTQSPATSVAPAVSPVIESPTSTTTQTSSTPAPVVTSSVFSATTSAVQNLSPNATATPTASYVTIGPIRQLESREIRDLERQKKTIIRELRILERLARTTPGSEVAPAEVKTLRDSVSALKPADSSAYDALNTIAQYRDVIDRELKEAAKAAAHIRAVKERAKKLIEQGVRIKKKISQIEKRGTTIDRSFTDATDQMIALAKSIGELNNFDKIEEQDNRLSDIILIINSYLPRLDHLFNLPTIIRVLKLQIAEGERLLKITAATAKRLSFSTTDQLDQMKAVLDEMRSALKLLTSGSLPENIPAYVENQTTNPLDNMREIAGPIQAAVNVRDTVSKTAAAIKKYDANIKKMQKAGESTEETMVLRDDLSQHLSDLKPFASQRILAEDAEQVLFHLQAITEVRGELEDLLGLSSADQFEKQLNKLFGSSQKIERLTPFVP